jgi:membrane-associated protein
MISSSWSERKEGSLSRQRRRLHQVSEDRRTTCGGRPVKKRKIAWGRLCKPEGRLNAVSRAAMRGEDVARHKEWRVPGGLLVQCHFSLQPGVMDILLFLVDFIVHIDRHLAELAVSYGPWLFLILFLIIFCETGLVVTPILPGDSLLFVTGALAATGAYDIHLMALTLIVAAILGDSTNYQIGKMVGVKVFDNSNSRIFKKEYLDKTHAFFEKHGGKAIIIARFAPIVRTFAPFVAGVGAMTYPKFFMYNVVGGIAWVASFSYAGYFFGNLPIVKKNLSLLIVAIVILSILPGIIEYFRQRRRPG